MKKYTDLKELLLDYTTALIQSVDDGNINSERLADRFCSNNSLALGKQKPLAKNKQTENKPKCICNELHKSGAIGFCMACKTDWV